MATITIRTADDAGNWSDDRIAALTGSSTQIGDGAYPITGGELSGDGALLTVDTGSDGPTPAAGTATQLGVVE